MKETSIKGVARVKKSDIKTAGSKPGGKEIMKTTSYELQ